MDVSRENGYVKLSNKKSTVIWSWKEKIKPTEGVAAVMTPNFVDDSGNNVVSGEEEWEFGEIIISGYVGEKNNYYLVNCDNACWLFVADIADIDDAFRELSIDIDAFVIPVSVDVDEEALKKRLDSIDTGCVVFVPEDGTNDIVLKNASRVAELEQKSKISLTGKIADKKYFTILKK